MKRAVFLDRDGTLNVDVGYLHRLEDLELFPWTADALRLLKRAGYTLIVVTHEVFCRPCMLRECPIDHRCMRRISAAEVLRSI